MRAAISTCLVLGLLGSGCTTTQKVHLGRTAPPAVTSFALVADEGNSPQMDGFVQTAFIEQGLSAAAPLPKGTRTFPGVDALVSYVDVWRWDVAMYMQSISVKMYDAKTGDLLVIGEWADSPLHAWRDPKLVTSGLAKEMNTKVRTAAATGQAVPAAAAASAAPKDLEASVK